MSMLSSLFRFLDPEYESIDERLRKIEENISHNTDRWNRNNESIEMIGDRLDAFAKIQGYIYKKSHAVSGRWESIKK